MNKINTQLIIINRRLSSIASKYESIYLKYVAKPVFEHNSFTEKQLIDHENYYRNEAINECIDSFRFNLFKHNFISADDLKKKFKSIPNCIVCNNEYVEKIKIARRLNGSECGYCRYLDRPFVMLSNSKCDGECYCSYKTIKICEYICNVCDYIKITPDKHNNFSTKIIRECGCGKRFDIDFANLWKKLCVKCFKKQSFKKRAPKTNNCTSCNKCIYHWKTLCVKCYYGNN